MLKCFRERNFQHKMSNVVIANSSRDEMVEAKGRRKKNQAKKKSNRNSTLGKRNFVVRIIIP